MELIRDDPIVERIRECGTDYPRCRHEHYDLVLKRFFSDFRADRADERRQRKC